MAVTKWDLHFKIFLWVIFLSTIRNGLEQCYPFFSHTMAQQTYHGAHRITKEWLIVLCGKTALGKRLPWTPCIAQRAERVTILHVHSSLVPTSMRWHMSWEDTDSRRGEMIKQEMSQRINYIEVICLGES